MVTLFWGHEFSENKKQEGRKEEENPGDHSFKEAQMVAQTHEMFLGRLCGIDLTSGV